jgi:hypothetical protein
MVFKKNNSIDNSTDIEAGLLLQQEANEKLGSIEQIGEANALETSKVTDVIKGLEPTLDTIALNTIPREVQKMEIVPPTDDESALVKTFWQMLRGREGYTPKKGKDYFTKEEINDIKESIRTNLKKEVTPIKEKDYFTSKEVDDIVDEVFNKIPTPEDGKTPKRGVDYFTDADIRNFVYDILIRIPKPEAGEPGKNADEEKIIDRVINKLSKHKEVSREMPKEIADRLNTLSRAVDWKVLKNVPDMPKHLGGGGQDVRIKYGGQTLTAVLREIEFVGAGVQVESLGDGVLRVTIPGGGGGGGFNIETPVGVINSSNDTFTVTNEPVQVVSDGVTYFDGFGYDYLAGTITMEIPPSLYLRSIY